MNIIIPTVNIDKSKFILLQILTFIWPVFAFIFYLWFCLFIPFEISSAYLQLFTSGFGTFLWGLDLNLKSLLVNWGFIKDIHAHVHILCAAKNKTKNKTRKTVMYIHTYLSW